MKALLSPSQCRGSIRIPASKSQSHRALICAGLASGTSVISNLSHSRDIQVTIECLQAMNARIQYSGQKAVVQGCRPQDLTSLLKLDAYESGSTLRFFIPIAASGAEPVEFFGQPSLLSRPMGVYADVFLSQNLRFGQSSSQISFQGPLQPGLFEIPGNVSSQFISGLLFAAPLLGECEIAVLPPYESRSYVDMTVDMMKRFGIAVQQPTDHGYIVPANQTYQPQNFSVEGDYSQLAFFGVLAALSGCLTCTNIEKNSLQGDRIILQYLQRAGADVTWNEEGNQVTIARNTLKPCTFDLADCPDLGPILCVLAAFLPGVSQLTNASRLRFKESDRIEAMEEELRKWGVCISSTQDTITIQGKSHYSLANPVCIEAHNDHRIVMAMSVFAMCAGSECQINGIEAVQKSYPGFFEDLRKIGGKAEIS